MYVDQGVYVGVISTLFVKSPVHFGQDKGVYRG